MKQTIREAFKKVRPALVHSTIQKMYCQRFTDVFPQIKANYLLYIFHVTSMENHENKRLLTKIKTETLTNKQLEFIEKKLSGQDNCDLITCLNTALDYADFLCNEEVLNNQAKKANIYMLNVFGRKVESLDYGPESIDYSIAKNLSEKVLMITSLKYSGFDLIPGIDHNPELHKLIYQELTEDLFLLK